MTVDDCQSSRHRGGVVQRATETLRPHPTYQELCGPIALGRVRRVAQQQGPIREPLLTTAEGTILDGHARWQVAMDRQQSSLPCIEYYVTDDEALQIVIQHHRASEGLNNFCRIVMALELEPSFRERSRRARTTTGAGKPSSNLTNDEHRDVRKAIASVAGVSTGNVTKVKQLLSTVIQETRARLLWGEVSIHRAWQWRQLSVKQQRDALWGHRNRHDIRHTIRRLLKQHTESQGVVPTGDQVRAALGALATHAFPGTAIVVADIPGNAIVVTRECYEDLLRRQANSQRGRATA